MIHRQAGESRDESQDVHVRQYLISIVPKSSYGSGSIRSDPWNFEKFLNAAGDLSCVMFQNIVCCPREKRNSFSQPERF
jgi:hypothetical protein